MKLIVLIVLIVFTLTAHSANTNSDLKKCESAIEIKDDKSIVKYCISLEKNSQKAELFVIVAELFQNISYSRLNEIFDYGEADQNFVGIYNKKKSYSALEKSHLKKAFGRLKKQDD